jgi:hypothetical protein
VLLSALVYLSVLCRAAAATHNRVAAPVIVALSALLVTAVGVLPFISNAVLDTRCAARCAL